MMANLEVEKSGVLSAGFPAKSRTSHGFGSSSSKYLFSAKNATEDYVKIEFVTLIVIPSILVIGSS